MSRYAARPLRVGQRVRVRLDGPVFEVERVSPGAAYLRPASRGTALVTVPVVKTRTVHGQRLKSPVLDENGEVKTRTFEAAVSGPLEAVSRNAFVYDASEETEA